MDKTTHEVRLQNWTTILQNCAESGLSKQEWCRQNGISHKSFFYWQRKVRLQAVALQNEPSPAPAFAEISVTPSEPVHERNAFLPDVVIRNRTMTIEISNTASDRLLSAVERVARHAQ